MDLLPIGSVVRLKDATNSLMIIGILVKKADGKMYDYIACPYPLGYIGENGMFLFNGSDIETTEYIGLDDSERQDFIKRLEKDFRETNNKTEE